MRQREISLRRLAEVNPRVEAFDSMPDDRLVTFAPLETIWSDDRLDLSRTRPAAEVRSGYTRFAEGDVLVPKVTPTHQAGRSAVAQSLTSGVGAGTSELHVLRARPGLANARWLRYVVLSKRYLEEGEAAFEGVAGLQRVPAEYLMDFPVPPMPLEVQWRIADFLDDQTTRIDRIIEARQMQTALLKEMWQSELDAAFSLHERTTRLANFARVQTGITLNAGRVADATAEIPYLRVANVQAGRIDLREIKHVQATPEQISRHSVRLGDVLMTEGGDLDKLGRGTVWEGQIDSVLHQNHVFAVRTKRDLLVPEFLAFYTESTRARAYFEVTGSRSTNLASTSATKVLDLPVPVVAPLEQEAILARLRSTRSRLDEQSLTLEHSTKVLQELKRSLISAAVSGEFDVSSADGGRVVA